MRRGILVMVLAGTALTVPASPAVSQEEPPRGPCNRGTTRAHATVPHETEGNFVAHGAIPHCH